MCYGCVCKAGASFFPFFFFFFSSFILSFFDGSCASQGLVVLLRCACGEALLSRWATAPAARRHGRPGLGTRPVDTPCFFFFSFFSQLGQRFSTNASPPPPLCLRRCRVLHRSTHCLPSGSPTRSMHMVHTGRRAEGGGRRRVQIWGSGRLGKGSVAAGEYQRMAGRFGGQSGLFGWEESAVVFFARAMVMVMV